MDRVLYVRDRAYFKTCYNVTVNSTDSQSALNAIQNSSHHDRRKHIDIKQHFMSQLVDKKHLKMKYLKMEEMPADFLIKQVPAANEKTIVNFRLIVL